MLCAGAGALVGTSKTSAQTAPIRIADQPTEIALAQISSHTVRLSLVPIENGQPKSIPDDGLLVQRALVPSRIRLRTLTRVERIPLGKVTLTINSDPLTITATQENGRLVQQLRIDQKTGTVFFKLGDGPLLGLGEGGPQFDRRGNKDEMRSGQGGYRLRTHGGRVPIPWLVGTSGWAMFIHQPFGTFDFTGAESKFQPPSPDAALPLDIFFIASSEPATIMAEYARLTGYAEMPPLWS